MYILFHFSSTLRLYFQNGQVSFVCVCVCMCVCVCVCVCVCACLFDRCLRVGFFFFTSLHLLCPESAFSPDGRPLEPAFYTGATGYQNLIHEIFRHKAMIDGSSPQGTEHVESTSTQEGEGAAGREPGAASPPLEEEAGSSYARPLVWVKKDTLSNLLHEELSEAQVRDIVL